MGRKTLIAFARAVLPDAAVRIISLYRYRSSHIPAISGKQKIAIARESLRRGLRDRKTILCYPQKPDPGHAFYKMMAYLGYNMTTAPDDVWVIAIKWFNAWDGNPFLPKKKDILQQIVGRSSNLPFLNIDCEDITKERVGRIFAEVFGYSVAVDPTKTRGQCVAKSNWNGLHEGTVIQCPIQEPQPNVTYQRVVNNEVDGGWVQDMRVPVLGGKVPFVYLKWRSVENRFVDRQHTAAKATIAEVKDVLTREEITKIGLFCEKLGLDYCEVDVLRDRNDGKIYIVDVNNTPFGPPSPISGGEGMSAVARLAEAFEEVFGVSNRAEGRIGDETRRDLSYPAGPKS